MPCVGPNGGQFRGDALPRVPSKIPSERLRCTLSYERGGSHVRTPVSRSSLTLTSCRYFEVCRNMLRLETEWGVAQLIPLPEFPYGLGIHSTLHPRCFALTRINMRQPQIVL